MKLTIKNYKNILGEYGKWTIINAVELPDYYVFSVMVNGKITSARDVFVKRNGRFDNDGEWIYHFGRNNSTQCVTPKWFGDKVNAVSAIVNEYDGI